MQTSLVIPTMILFLGLSIPAISAGSAMAPDGVPWADTARKVAGSNLSASPEVDLGSREAAGRARCPELGPSMEPNGLGPNIEPNGLVTQIAANGARGTELGPNIEPHG